MPAVLLCGEDVALTRLVRLNLERRGFTAVEAIWNDCLDHPEQLRSQLDLIVADLAPPEPECWEHAAQMRAAFPGLPLVLFAHAWADPVRLAQWHPCHCLRKPFPMNDLLQAVARFLPLSQ